MDKKRLKHKQRHDYTVVVGSLLAGLLVSTVVLFAVGFNAFEVYRVLLVETLNSPKQWAFIIVRATPLILTGLSVGFALRAGILNIGAEGQYIMGGVIVLLLGFLLPPMPSILLVPLLLVAGFGVGGAYAGIAALLKTSRGAHEVVTTVMLNWVALYFSNFIVGLALVRVPNTDITHSIQEAGRLQILSSSLSSGFKEQILSIPFFSSLFQAPLHYGIVVALFCALVYGIITKYTVFGYKIRSVGSAPETAEYGGISIFRYSFWAFFISGGLAGLAGAVQLMGVPLFGLYKLAGMEGYGFDGITVALLGGLQAGGVVLSGFFLGFLKYGSFQIQSHLGVPSELMNVFIGLLIFFLAMPRFFQLFKEHAIVRSATLGFIHYAKHLGQHLGLTKRAQPHSFDKGSSKGSEDALLQNSPNQDSPNQDSPNQDSPNQDSQTQDSADSKSSSVVESESSRKGKEK